MSTPMSSAIDELPDDAQFEKEEPIVVKASPSNVKVDITKKVHFADEEMSFFQKLKAEINEENMLIFLFLFIANSPQFNDYAMGIPYLSTSGFVGIGRVVLLFVAYLVTKTFVLPQIKL